MESRWNVWYTCRDSEGWRMYSGAVVEGAFDVAWNVERHLKSGGRLLLYLPIYMKGCRAECGISKKNKSTEHDGEDLCEVVCDRLSLLTGAVLKDEQQGGYRVHRINLGTEASFRFRSQSVRAVPCTLGSSPSL